MGEGVALLFMVLANDYKVLTKAGKAILGVGYGALINPKRIIRHGPRGKTVTLERSLNSLVQNKDFLAVFLQTVTITQLEKDGRPSEDGVPDILAAMDILNAYQVLTSYTRLDRAEWEEQFITMGLEKRGWKLEALRSTLKSLPT